MLRRWALQELWEGAALLVVCALVLSGCGGGDNGTTQAQTETQATTESTVSAERYVSSVCSSLKAWHRQIETSRKEFRASTSPMSLADVRTGFLALLDDIVVASDRLADRVATVGTPDAEQGAQVAADFRRSLRMIKSFFVRLRVQVSELPVDNAAAFNRRLQAINSSLEPRVAALGKTFERLSTKSGSELRRAVTNSPACAVP